MSPTMQQPARVNPMLVLAVTTTLLSFASLDLAISREQSAQDERGPHGALEMDAQQAIVGKLLPQRDVTKPPESVDPEIWRSVVVPPDNRMTPERVALGKELYFEQRLSKDGTVACGTCHDVSRGFTDQRETSEGIGDALGQRNAPTSANAFLMETMFLDGRAPSLEEQAKLPIINPIEMGMPNQHAAIDAIDDDPKYQKMFKAAYGRGPNYEDLARAIAAFERTFVFLDAPFDRFLAGDENAISAQAKRGWTLFNGKARCMSCHEINPSNPIGTDNDFHNIGVAAENQNFERLADEALDRVAKAGGGMHVIDQLALQTRFAELGRFLVTGDRSDIGAFKTSQLRNIGVTGPYMHDGSLKTLWDVMDHYNEGGEVNPFLDGGIVPLGLSEDEIDAVVAFMFTLTDDRFAQQNQKLMHEQQKLATKSRPERDTAMAEGKVLPFEREVMGTTEYPEE
jgi:cytochrome c peroxidase